MKNLIQLKSSCMAIIKEPEAVHEISEVEAWLVMLCLAAPDTGQLPEPASYKNLYSLVISIHLQRTVGDEVAST